MLAVGARALRDATEGARRGEIFARATWFARDLVNAPANDVHPTHLAEVATKVAGEAGLRVTVLDRGECEKLGMGALLAVAAGSLQPPQFIHLTGPPGMRSGLGPESSCRPGGPRSARRRGTGR